MDIGEFNMDNINSISDLADRIKKLISENVNLKIEIEKLTKEVENLEIENEVLRNRMNGD